MSRRFASLGLLLAVGVGLQWIESLLALPSPLPGAKLGLANVATLIVLARFGGGTAALFGLLRHIAASLLTGSLLLPTFWLGLGGSLATALLLLLLGRGSSLRTAGVLGGAAFQVGQTAALLLLTATPGFLVYLPPLLALGVAAGWATGVLATLAERAVRPGWQGPADRAEWWAGSLLAAALALALLIRPAPASAREAVVTVAGREQLRIDLGTARELTLPVAGGTMVLQVEPGRIRVLSSDCPDQVCVLTGWIDRPGRPVYCAPFQTLITIQGGAPDLDSVIR
ncbi:MAG: Gx transporter family protein [Bacillota bacterium]